MGHFLVTKSEQCYTEFGSVTPRKTNMFAENQWLEDVFPIEIVHLLGDMLVFGGVS